MSARRPLRRPHEDVAQTYNNRMSLGLSASQIADIAQYLKSL